MTDYVWTERTARTRHQCQLCWLHNYEDEWEDEFIYEWLQDEHPTEWRQLLAGWRYPDGDRLPLPFQPRCVTCATLLSGTHAMWCAPCDEARIRRIEDSLKKENQP